MAGREQQCQLKEALTHSATGLLTNRKQNVLPKVKGKTKTPWLLLMFHESRTWGTEKLLLRCSDQRHQIKTPKTKPWKVFTIRDCPSDDSLLKIPWPGRILHQLICLGFLFDAACCDLSFRVVSDCNSYLLKGSDDKKWEFGKELCTPHKFSVNLKSQPWNLVKIKFSFIYIQINDIFVCDQILEKLKTTSDLQQSKDQLASNKNPNTAEI